jgi:hypothetical protein
MNTINIIQKTLTTVVKKFNIAGKKSTDASIALVEKYKFIRRIILAVMLVWMSILLKITISIVLNSEAHDIGPNFANILMAYFGLVTTFTSFYVVNRTKETNHKTDVTYSEDTYTDTDNNRKFDEYV